MGNKQTLRKATKRKARAARKHERLAMMKRGAGSYLVVTQPDSYGFTS